MMDDAWADYERMPVDVAPAVEPPLSAYEEDDRSGLAGEGITPLGYDRGSYFYLSHAKRQVVELTVAGHTRNALMDLASVPHYWELGRFKRQKGGGILWDEAIEYLMRACREAGIYDPGRVRGRGAWIDGVQSVLHMGDHLLVAGQRSPLHLPGSRHVYERALPFTDRDQPPLSAREAHVLMEICRSLRFSRGLDATLLAGFIVVAPICGALAWRPSIWLTGSKGSGKSWIEQNVLVPAIGQVALRVQGTTTEPAIRRVLGSDARPVLFDEAEQEDQAAQSRMQAILSLVRQSSTEDGAEIIKASQGDGVSRFRIRSCFAFSSINVGIVHSADESRITVLSLLPPIEGSRAARQVDEERFKALATRAQQVITPDFAAGLLARSVSLLPVIRRNAETFAKAVSIHLGERRLGDQIGTLLAGAYALHTDKPIHPEAAAEFVQREQWQQVEQPVERDEIRLLSRLTQARVDVASGSGGMQRLTLGRMLEAASRRDSQTVGTDTAQRELRERGIVYVHRGQTIGGQTGEGIFVSTRHEAIRDILKGSPWANGWADALKRLPSAQQSKDNVRFNTGHSTRAIWLPWNTIDPEKIE